MIIAMTQHVDVEPVHHQAPTPTRGVPIVQRQLIPPCRLRDHNLLHALATPTSLYPFVIAFALRQHVHPWFHTTR